MNDEDSLNFKIVLLGESGVGKTSIIDRYFKDDFMMDIAPSRAAFFSPKVVSMEGYKSFKFEIWDIPGNETSKRLAKIFLKKAYMFILVYDITNKKSFEELKNCWLELIKGIDSSNKSK